MCMCRGKWNQATSPGETDWGSYPMLFMKESCPTVRSLHLSRLPRAFISLSSLYSAFSFLSQPLTPWAHSPVFHSSGLLYHFSVSIKISLWTGPTRPPSPLCTCSQNMWWYWNSCLLAKTDALTHDLSFTQNKSVSSMCLIGSCNFGALEVKLIRQVNNLCAFKNYDKYDSWFISIM